jgi:hypothetical protein
MRRALTSLGLAVLLLVGCTTTSALRQTGRAGTALLLVQTDATVADAEAIKQTATTVRTMVSQDSYDTLLIKSFVHAAIANNYSGREEIVLRLLVDPLIEQIVEALVDSTNIPDDERAYIDAAAEGVEQGAQIYIDASQP